MNLDLKAILKNRNPDLGSKAEELWKLGQDKIFDMITEAGYTTHGRAHYYIRILHNLEKLLSNQTISSLNDLEIFSLLIAVYFHDIGMMDSDYPGQDIEQKRIDHAERSKNWIIQNLPSHGIPESVAKRIGEIARGHCLNSIKELLESNAYVNEGIYEGNIRLDVLTALLRISDILDWARNRAPLWLADLLNVRILNYFHWQIHNLIESIEIRNDDWKIIIHSIPKGPFSREQIKKIKIWIDLEVKECSNYLHDIQLYYTDAEIDEIPYSKEHITEPKIKPGSNPFPLLAPYDLNSRDLFFGRDDEVEKIFSHLMKNRFIIISGESGAGKTSILKAGVIPALFEFEINTIYLDKYQQPQKVIEKKLQVLLSNPQKKGFLNLIEECIQNRKKVVLILDQFEAAFNKNTPTKFLNDIVKIIKDNKKDIPIIFGITGENLLNLISYLQKNSLSEFDVLGDSIISIERIREETAKRIVKKSFDFLNINITDRANKKLIQHISDPSTKTIFLPHLQIVCHRLAALVIKEQEKQITIQIIEKLGLPDDLLSAYYNEVCDLLSNLGIQILSLLIDSEGKRIPVSEESINRLAKISDETSNEIENLDQKRLILKRPGGIELVHDLLAYGIYKKLDSKQIKGKEAKEALGRLIKDWQKNHNLLADPYRLSQIYVSRDNININSDEARFLLTSGLNLGVLYWYWLFKLRSLEGNIIPALKDMLKIKNQIIRQNATKALLKFKDVNDFLAGLLTDENEQVKLHAIEGLSLNDGSETISMLKPVLDEDSKPIKLAIVNKLQNFYGPEIESYIIERLSIEKDLECLELLLLPLRKSDSEIVVDTIFTKIKEFQENYDDGTDTLFSSFYIEKNEKYIELINLSFAIIGSIGISKQWEEIIQFGLEYGFDYVVKCLALNLNMSRFEKISQQISAGSSPMSKEQFKLILANINKIDLLKEYLKLIKTNVKFSEYEGPITEYIKILDPVKNKQLTLNNLQSKTFKTSCDALLQSLYKKHLKYADILKYYKNLEKNLISVLKEQILSLSISDNKDFFLSFLKQNKKSGNYGIQSRISELTFIQLPLGNDSKLIKELENIYKRHKQLVQTCIKLIQIKFPFLSNKLKDFSKEENQVALIFRIIDAYEKNLSALQYINIYLYPSSGYYKPETKLDELKKLFEISKASIEAFKIAVKWFEPKTIENNLLNRLLNACQSISKTLYNLPSVYQDSKTLRKISKTIIDPFTKVRSSIITTSINLNNVTSQNFLKSIYFYDDFNLWDYLSDKKNADLKRYLERLWRNYEKGKISENNLFSKNQPYVYFRNMSIYKDQKAINRAKEFIHNDDDILARWALHTIYLSDLPEKTNLLESVLWKNSDWLKEIVIDYLSEIEKEKIIEKIIPFLNDRNEKTRNKVVTVIDKIDWEVSIESFKDN